MIKTFYRLIIYFFSKFIKTDDLSDKFPVSIKSIIIDDNKVLCLKNERNEWDFAGGKINFNEDIEECLKREVKEEQGKKKSTTKRVILAILFLEKKGI